MANIGILKEFENGESRVALNDHAIVSLINNGNKVFVTSNAGLKSGIDNSKYENSGAIILSTNKDVIEKSDIIMKIQKPNDLELSFFKKKQVLFCFLNLTTDTEMAIKLSKANITAIGYETIYDDNKYPILEPMSKLVGKLSYVIGASLLSMPSKGKGIFLGGSAGASRSKIVIFGGGNAGKELVKLANSSGSRVTVFDKDLSVINSINDENPQIQTMYPYHDLIIKEIENADLVVGATFSGKNKVNTILTTEMIKMMEPKSVFIDLTSECGGISHTSAYDKTRKSYIYQKHNIIHYCVPNIASTIPKTATSALSAPILHYLIRFLITEYVGKSDHIINDAIQVKDGKIAEHIKIDNGKNSNEYNQKIKTLVINEDDDEYDLESMIENDSEINKNSNSLKYERDIFDPEKEERSPLEDDIAHKKENLFDEDDDLFGDYDFTDIDIK